MLPLDPQITALCVNLKITDYLRSRGVDVLRSGYRWKCKCPLPGHPNETDPSFYITPLSSGVEVYNCFGCDSKGGLISLISAIEHEKKQDVINRLAAEYGVTLGKFDPAVRIEPTPFEIDETFCEEQDASRQIAQYGVQFMRTNITDDAINKISRLYEIIDKKTREGDLAEIARYKMLLEQSIEEYD